MPNSKRQTDRRDRRNDLFAFIFLAPFWPASSLRSQKAEGSGAGLLTADCLLPTAYWSGLAAGGGAFDYGFAVLPIYFVQPHVAAVPARAVSLVPDVVEHPGL